MTDSKTRLTITPDEAELQIAPKQIAPRCATVQDLIDAARDIPMTAAEREIQRRSFVYGNTTIGNPRITRGLIDKAAEDEANVDRSPSP